MKTSRSIDIGEIVKTSYSGKVTEHVVTAKKDNMPSESRLCFIVKPSVPKSGDGWMDSKWFYQ